MAFYSLTPLAVIVDFMGVECQGAEAEEGDGRLEDVAMEFGCWERDEVACCAEGGRACGCRQGSCGRGGMGGVEGVGVYCVDGGRGVGAGGGGGDGEGGAEDPVPISCKILSALLNSPFQSET